MATLNPTFQLPLGLQLSDETTFDNFLTTPNNRDSIGTFRESLTHGVESLLLLWGPSGSGLSHLLQAAAHQLQRKPARAFYLPMHECLAYDPALFNDLTTADTVVLDDIHLISNRPDWQEALFHLYNRLKDVNKQLIVSSHQAPATLNIALADLKSRLNGGLTVAIQPLKDEDKVRCLMDNAKRRGLQLDNEAAGFLLHRLSRAMPALMAALDELDKHSLIHKRRLTIPFIKATLAL